MSAQPEEAGEPAGSGFSGGLPMQEQESSGKLQVFTLCFIYANAFNPHYNPLSLTLQMGTER